MKKTLLILTVILFTHFSYSQNEIEKAQNEVKNAQIELEKAIEKLEQLEKLEQQKTKIQKNDTQQSEINEPEWIGQAVYLNNGETLELESQKAYLKANASASMFIVGVGKVKSKWMVKGNKSNFRIKSNNNIKFIVNAGSNGLNPKSVITIVKLLTDKKNKRYYIGSSSGTFTGSKSGDLDLVTFKAKKYGKTSYEVTIPNVGDGEYVMIINGSMDWNLFGIE
jgi:hypothetical protein